MTAPAGGPATLPMGAFFDHVCEDAERAAAAAGGWTETAVDLGGVATRVRALGGTACRMVRAFAAAPVLPAGTPLEVDLLTTGPDGIPLPTTMWDWTEFDYRAGSFRFEFDPDRRMLVATDVEGGRAVVWFATERIGAWEHAAPLRPILDRLLAARGLTMVHAAAVGRAGRAVLLPGPGGSGKSTTVQVALARGFDTVGDDFLLSVPGDVPTVARLYRTMRLRTTSPLFDPQRHVVADDGFGNDKALLFVDEDHPAQLATRQEVVAMAAPVLTGQRDSAVVPVPTGEVLKALLPSSLILADRQPAAMSALIALARSVPSYRLDVGTDLDGVLAVIDELLERHGATCAS